MRQVRLQGKHKLTDKWEPSVYIVVCRAGELPVYTVKPEGEGPLRTLHWDLLLPSGFLAVSTKKASNPPNPASRPRTRQQVSGGDFDEDGADDTARSLEFLLMMNFLKRHRVV